MCLKKIIQKILNTKLCPVDAINQKIQNFANEMDQNKNGYIELGELWYGLKQIYKYAKQKSKEIKK